VGVEYERKFLVTSDGWRGLIVSSKEIEQGYVSRGSQAVTRVRVAPGHAELTIKGAAPGDQRPEFNFPIGFDKARELLAIFTDTTIQKVRHTLELGPEEWTVDEFLGTSAGLFLLEVESRTPISHVPVHPWMGADVTDDIRYSNAYLDQHPYGSDSWKVGR
jgi:adenylate cyclase